MRRLGRLLDTVGVVLVAATAAWALRVGAVTDTNPWPFVWLLAACTLTFVAARLVAATAPRVPPALLAAAVLASVVVTVASIGSAGGGPLGYANSNASLALLGVAAALSARVPGARSHRLAYGAALAAVAVVVVTRSAAAIALLLVWGALGWVLRTTRRRRAAAPLAVIGVLLAVQVVAAIGVRGEGTDVRVALWSDATGLAAANPTYGVGVGRFAQESITAGSDADLRWAHSEFLQHAVEQGLPGLVLVLLLVAWAAARLWAMQPFGDRGLLACLALGAVASHAAMDHVLHDWPVPIALAALVGAATATATARPRPVAPAPVLLPGTRGSPLPRPSRPRAGAGATR